jgi:erythromycin esterase-like protein
LSRPRLHRSIGSGFDPNLPSGNFERCKLPEVYDGLIFIAESTAARPI